MPDATLPRPTKALSVRAPWWWAILNGKDIENRDWPTRIRGTVYLHASKWWNWVEVLEDLGFCDAHLRPEVLRSKAAPLRPSGGCLVGRVDVVDCITRSDSPWFFGPYGFVLANPVAFATPIPCRGMLNFFTLPDDVLALAEAAEVRS